MKLGKENRKKFRIDFSLFIPAVIISVIGIVALLSTTIESTGGFGNLDIVKKQAIFILLGIIIYFITSRLDVSIFKYPQVIIPIYILTILLLIAVFVFGPVINNVQRWLVIGGVQIQPSEIAKITVIITTAVIFSLKYKYNQWLLFLISFIAVLPIFLLVYFEPAGSMSFLILVIWFLVAFTGLSNQLRNTILLLIVGLLSSSLFLYTFNDNTLYLLIALVGVIIAVFGFYFRDNWKPLIIISLLIGITLGGGSIIMYKSVLKDYQKSRIESFLDPTTNTEGIGFNVNQARIAIGSGKITGKGFGSGTQSKRGFLPEHQTDFIFASFAEEFGLIGSLFLISIFGILIVRILILSLDIFDDVFSSIIVVGIAMKILLEVFINIGTNLGIIPATGIPLPLVSAGGTITLVTFFSLGLIQSIINRSTNERNSKSIIDNY